MQFKPSLNSLTRTPSEYQPELCWLQLVSHSIARIGQLNYASQKSCAGFVLKPSRWAIGEPKDGSVARPPAPFYSHALKMVASFAGQVTYDALHWLYIGSRLALLSSSTNTLNVSMGYLHSRAIERNICRDLGDRGSIEPRIVVFRIFPLSRSTLRQLIDSVGVHVEPLGRAFNFPRTLTPLNVGGRD